MTPPPRSLPGTGGPYRPLPLLLISQRLYQLLTAHKVKRFDVEVAHVVED